MLFLYAALALVLDFVFPHHSCYLFLVYSYLCFFPFLWIPFTYFYCLLYNISFDIFRFYLLSTINITFLLYCTLYNLFDVHFNCFSSIRHYVSIIPYFQSFLQFPFPFEELEYSRRGCFFYQHNCEKQRRIYCIILSAIYISMMRVFVFIKYLSVCYIHWEKWLAIFINAFRIISKLNLRLNDSNTIPRKVLYVYLSVFISFINIFKLHVCLNLNLLP